VPEASPSLRVAVCTCSGEERERSMKCTCQAS
jgi:hypothetical protein